MGTDIIAIYIFIQFMQSIPVSLDEAAMIDGANRWTIYWRIILPLLKPAIATVVIIKGIAIYNEFYMPFLYLPSRGRSSPRRCSGSRGRSARSGRSSPPARSSSSSPPSSIFLLLQRWIYKGLTSGAVK